MLVLILALIFGLGVALFATQNTNSVTITLANYPLKEVPLYMIVIGSLLVGLFISWVISLAHTISSSLTIHGKDNAISEAKQTIAALQKRIHDLEVANTHLRGETKDEVVVEKKEEPVQYPLSLLDRIKHTFNRAYHHPSFR